MTDERELEIHRHDCPTFRKFWERHAMLSKVCPSCLLCGQQSDPANAAITHAELPNIFICQPCAAKARR